jgi:hypothetical protein
MRPSMRFVLMKDAATRNIGAEAASCRPKLRVGRLGSPVGAARRIAAPSWVNPIDLLQLCPSNRLRYEMPSLDGVTPAAELYPLTGFEVLVVFEEVLNLLQRDLRQVGVVVHV